MQSPLPVFFEGSDPLLEIDMFFTSFSLLIYEESGGDTKIFSFNCNWKSANELRPPHGPEIPEFPEI